MPPRLDPRCLPASCREPEGVGSVPVPVCSQGDGTVTLPSSPEGGHKAPPQMAAQWHPSPAQGWRISGFRVWPPPWDGASWLDLCGWVGTERVSWEAVRVGVPTSWPETAPFPMQGWWFVRSAPCRGSAGLWRGLVSSGGGDGVKEGPGGKLERRRALGPGWVEARSSGLEAEACAGALFPSLSLLHPEASEPLGPQTEAALGVEDEPCSSLGGERGARADPAPARCFLVEHGWTWAEPSPSARRRGPSSPRVPGAHGVPLPGVRSGAMFLPAPWSFMCACVHGVGVGKPRCLV